VSAWKGNDKVGEGEQEITKFTDDKRIDTELRFKTPFESTAQAFLILDDEGGNQTKVTWGFDTAMPRPFNLMSLFMDMDGEVGKDFDEGLANLKRIMESKSAQ
jgi:hypothetical protein